MSSRVTQWVFIGVVVAVGVLFFRVIGPFLVPLLLAAVLAMLFRPLFRWIAGVLHGYDHVAAGLTTVALLLLLIVPLSVAVFFAGRELTRMGRQFVSDSKSRQDGDAQQPAGDPTSAEGNPVLERVGSLLEGYLSQSQIDRVKEWLSSSVSRISGELYQRTRGLLSSVIEFLIGFAVMTLALYYFLAEGPAILEHLKVILPVEEADAERLFEQFDSICRGVVAGSLLAALVQGILNGIAFAIAGIEPIWLLASLTVLFSLIPFLGAAGVYLPVAAYLLFDGQHGWAIFVLAWGIGLTSTSDNLVRAYVVGGWARLHPLVVLISMLGALRVVGLWGILVGPMIAGFFYALLKMLREKMAAGEAEGEAGEKAESEPV